MKHPTLYRYKSSWEKILKETSKYTVLLQENNGKNFKDIEDLRGQNAHLENQSSGKGKEVRKSLKYGNVSIWSGQRGWLYYLTVFTNWQKWISEEECEHVTHLKFFIVNSQVQFHDNIKAPKNYVYYESLDDKTFIKKIIKM